MKPTNNTQANINIGRESISVKEIIHRYKLSYQTINHYTDLGLLSVLFKKGNARFYNRALVEERLKAIRDLMKEGYNLRLIRKKIIGI